MVGFPRPQPLAVTQTPSAPTALTYRDAGVDIDAGNEVVERIKPLVKRSFRPEVMGGLGGFGAMFDLSAKYKEPVLVSGTDGVGTKLKLAQQLNRHDTIGIDLVAMCVNDVLVPGRRAAVLPRLFRHRQARCRHHRVGRRRHREGLRTVRVRTDRRRNRGNARHVSAGRIRPGRLLRRWASRSRRSSTAHKVREGDVLIGIASSGPHSNGYSLIRRIYERAGRPADHDLGDGTTLVDALMAPTTPVRQTHP